MKKKRTMNHSFKRVTKKEIEYAASQGYLCLYNIKWETDGSKEELPKAVAVPKEMLDSDFDPSLEGADFLSNKYGWLVKSFSFESPQ